MEKRHRRRLRVPMTITEEVDERIDPNAKGSASDSPETSSSIESSPMVAHKKTCLVTLMEPPKEIPKLLEYIQRFFTFI